MQLIGWSFTSPLVNSDPRSLRDPVVVCVPAHEDVYIWELGGSLDSHLDTLGGPGGGPTPVVPVEQLGSGSETKPDKPSVPARKDGTPSYLKLVRE